MPTLLITGANRGVGLELTRQYVADGWEVHACCRDPDKAGELRQLANAKVYRLDVSREESIVQLAERLVGIPIDLLLNNAGVYGGDGNKLGGINTEEWLQVFRINTIAPLLMAQSFLKNISNSNGKTIATLTSKVGSIADNSGGSNYMYRSSKTAVNQAMKSLSIDTADLGIKTAVLHPGWVQTEMGGPNALITTEQSASGLIKVINNLTPEQSGGFYNYDGTEIPW